MAVFYHEDNGQVLSNPGMDGYPSFDSAGHKDVNEPEYL